MSGISVFVIRFSEKDPQPTDEKRNERRNRITPNGQLNNIPIMTFLTSNIDKNPVMHPIQLIDRYNRRLNYLRISITDRCNLRCIYRMPERGLPKESHDDILRSEGIPCDAVVWTVNRQRFF